MTSSDGWRQTRAKYLFRAVDERAGSRELPLLSVSKTRGVVRRDSLTSDEARADDLSNYKVCDVGDIVVNRMSAYEGALGMSSHVGIVSPDYMVLRLGSELEPRFFHHLFRSAWFVGEMAARVRGIGGTDQGNVRTPRINAEDLGQIRVRVPPLSAQSHIAASLDSETARVDALIEKKRRMIELLEERWLVRVRALISGESNDPFPLLPLKRRWRVIDCKHRTPAYVPDGYPVVSPGDITPGPLDLSVCHRFVDGQDFADLTDGRRPRRGDLIYSRNASIGIAAYVGTDDSFCMGQDVCLITSRDQDQRFLMYALNTVGLDQLDERKIGSTFSRINVAQIMELRVPCPPSSVQNRVADAVEGEQVLHDSLTARLQAQIDLLAEHRQALVTAAVTGDLDVAVAP